MYSGEFSSGINPPLRTAIWYNKSGSPSRSILATPHSIPTDFPSFFSNTPSGDATGSFRIKQRIKEWTKD